jgi:hypothetical protein
MTVVGAGKMLIGSEVERHPFRHKQRFVLHPLGTHFWWVQGGYRFSRQDSPAAIDRKNDLTLLMFHGAAGQD